MTSPNEHLAAILLAQGGPLTSIALNPIDHYQRDHGFPPLAGYPSIIGLDISGIVLSAGPSVGPDAPKPGTRVCAFTSSFFEKGAPDFGALQERVVVPASNVCPIPDAMPFNEASILPTAVATTWAGWSSIGLPRHTRYSTADKQGLLVWGAATSIGSAAVQIAKLMGFTVFAVASEKNHAYITSLGASEVFDYHDVDVVAQIELAAKRDGLVFRWGFSAAAGAQEPSMTVLQQLKGDDNNARLASATHLPEGFTAVEGVEVEFVAAPMHLEARSEHFHFIFNVWLKEKLQTGEVMPSPKIKVIDGGLESANRALDELRAGVSCTKLVLDGSKERG